MKKLTALLVMLAMLLSAAASVAVAADTSPFTDVKLGKWYSDAVLNVYENGLMEGKGAGTFAPFENMTRAQLVMILSRLAKADVTGCAASLDFKDTKKNSWYSDAIGWAVAEGLVTGYTDNTFKPDERVLRQELATLFSRFLDYSYIVLPEKGGAENFADAAAIPKWAAKDIEKMRLTGIVTGDESGRFNPAQSATRAEIAMILTRYLAALENAADPMHAKLKDIKSLVRLDKGKIAIDLYLYERLTDYGHKNSVSEQLLPQMGLDTETYEMVAPKDTLLLLNQQTVLAHSAGQEEKETFFIKGCAFYIRNKITGECTEEQGLSFVITRHLTPETDPDTFDPGTDREVYEEMLSRSLVSTGNVARFAKAFEKAQRGESITVGYIGGSITQGAISGTNRQNCYAKVYHSWIQKQFPNSDVKYHNAGIGGTDSVYGLTRAEAHLLAYAPDIVFIEYSVNDGDVEGTRQYYEALIRKCLTDENSPAVAIIISHSAGDEITAREYGFGAHYGLPVIDVDEGVDYGIDAGEFTDAEYMPDGIHPYEWGHRVMADMLINMTKAVMKQIETSSADELTVTPPPTDTTTKLDYESLVYIPAEKLTADERGTWTLSKSENIDGTVDVLTAKAGDTLTLKLHAKSLLLLIDGNASINVTVNGKQTASLSNRSNHANVYTSDVASDITVVITATGDSAIRGFNYN